MSSLWTNLNWVCITRIENCRHGQVVALLYWRSERLFFKISFFLVVCFVFILKIFEYLQQESQLDLRIKSILLLLLMLKVYSMPVSLKLQKHLKKLRKFLMFINLSMSVSKMLKAKFLYIWYHGLWTNTEKKLKKISSKVFKVSSKISHKLSFKNWKKKTAWMNNIISGVIENHDTIQERNRCMIWVEFLSFLALWIARWKSCQVTTHWTSRFRGTKASSTYTTRPSYKNSIAAKLKKN